MIAILLLALTYHPSAQVALLGRVIPQSVPAPTTPCDLVSGCVAVYSAQRKMLASYSGALFQLKRTSDNATQDIGLSGGVVDQATINSFCGGAPSGSGRSTTTVNGCKWKLIYDHTGNGNTLSSMDSTYAECLQPYTQTAGGKPWFVNGPSGDHCFFGKKSPVSIPSGNAAVSVYVAGNDQAWPVESTPFGYGLTIGVVHDFVVADPNGSSFAIDLRGGPTCNACGYGDSDYLTFGVDEEADVVEVPYGISDHNLTEVALSPNVASYGTVGDFVGGATYNVSTSDIEMDFQYGLPTARHNVVNWNATNTSSMTGLNIGGGAAPEIREGFTQDNTGAIPGAWYEAAIYASTLTLTQLRQLETNGQTFLSITAPTPCSNGGVDLLGGQTVVTGAWGLRQLDPTRPAPVVVIARADNGNLKVLGTASGTCAPDVSTVATFCSGTTCHVYDLPNQVVSSVAVNKGWQGRIQDPTRKTSGGSATTGPTFTLNGLNSTLPVMTCGGGDVLTSLGSANAVTRPYTVAAAAKRTATGGALFQDGGGTNLFHDSGSANLLRVHSSSGTQTASAIDGTWYATAGTVVGGVLKAYVNGAASTSGTLTTGDTASSTWKLCNGWTGAFTEAFLINGADAGATALANLSTVQRAIGGY